MTDAEKNSSTTILIVDDEPLNLELLAQELEDEGYKLVEAQSGEAALTACLKQAPDLILLDIMMPGMDGLETCKRLKADAALSGIPIIFMTALSEAEDKVAAFQAGGADYITKPFQSEEVLARIRVHIKLQETGRSLQSRNQQLEQQINALQDAQQTIHYLRQEIADEFHDDEIIGSSGVLNAAMKELAKVAPTDASVLLLGETGTGKELFARSIHQNSSRAEKPFIKVNCATLPSELVESELFGHERGAFTGATTNRKGRFELADSGSLFLDEVGELPLAAQAKLLRILQEQELERVGSESSIKVDVRIIAATNQDLSTAVQTGTFRDDLYFRLNVFPITIPALRMRNGDISLLAEYLTALSARRLGKQIDAIDADSLERLENYSWPGNVRELQNVIERAVILSQGSLLEIGELVEKTDQSQSTSLETIEAEHILTILRQSDWKIEGTDGAAKRLGLHPSTLRGKMRKLAISKADN